MEGVGHRPIAITLVALVWALAGCGSDDGEGAVDGFPKASHEYDGPLFVDKGRYGAAAEALDCPVAAGQWSHAATSDSVREALETAVSEGLFLFAPTDEVRLAKAEENRALLTYEAEGRVLMALVFRDGPAPETSGGPGWYLESAARCDFAEFPEEFAERAGYRLWRDGEGRPAPVAKVYSAPGPQHCAWDSMEFLYVEDRLAYVQDPVPELRRWVAGPYQDDVPVPGDAQDTGVERDGRHLWVSADRTYAYVGAARHAEAWPRFEAGCA